MLEGDIDGFPDGLGVGVAAKEKMETKWEELINNENYIFPPCLRNST